MTSAASASAALAAALLLSSTSAGAWPLHARATAQNSAVPMICNNQTGHAGCTRMTRECWAYQNPTNSYAHASYHKLCKKHLDASATPGAFAHAHHGPHSTSPCMRNSIETRYLPGRAEGRDPHREDEPAEVRRELSLPPPPDADGTFGYLSAVFGGDESPGLLTLAPQSRLQIDTRGRREDEATVVAIRICVASSDGSRMEEGLVEFLSNEGERRIRAEGFLLEIGQAEPQAYDGRDGVWTVPLDDIEIRFDWAETDGDAEILVEVASAEN